MPPETHKTQTDPQAIMEKMLELVAGSIRNITPVDLNNTLTRTYGLDKTRIKALLKDLVAQGELAYRYEHGCTYLETSFNRPVRISRSVVLKPPGYRFRPEPNDVVIRIKPGASFGDGRHPTTRLALRGIEFVFEKLKPFVSDRQSTVLDIGTGSGVLVMTAVRFGIQNGLGLDTDACARAEARENVTRNGLQSRITIADRSVEDLQHPFSMVLANLRVPTLGELCAHIDAVTSGNGLIVLSGFRCHERTGLMALYAAHRYECLWSAEEGDWAGVVIKKG